MNNGPFFFIQGKEHRSVNSLGRRTFLCSLSATGVAIFAGCTGRTDRTPEKRPVDSREIKVTDPVRTEGDPVYVSSEGVSETDTETILRTAISNRMNCIEGEIPISAYDSGELITTESIVKSIEGNILFPSPVQRELKEVTPRSIIVTSSQNMTTEETPVYIKSILRYGKNEENIPRRRSDC